MFAILMTVGLLAFATALLFVPLQFGVHRIQTANRNKFYIYASLFGILIRIPIHTKKDHSKSKAKSKKKSKAQNKPALTFHTFHRNVEKLHELYKESKHELTEMLSYVRRHLSCKELDFQIAFGLDNAAKTGITTGAVWTSGTLLLKIIDSLIGIQKMNMNVYPDFQNKRFEISFKTILIMRPIHFIIIYRKISKTTKYIKSQLSKLK